MLKRELQIAGGKSLEYCTIVLNETVLMVTDGAIGENEQKKIKDSRSKMFTTKQKAKAAYEELVQQKLDEGYLDIGQPSGAQPSSKKQPLKTETLVLRYSDTDVLYNIVSAQFDVTENKLDICIELEVSEAGGHDWPPEILIRFANLAMEGQNRSLQVHDEHKNWDSGDYDDSPHAYVYSGFHHGDVSARVDIKTHQDSQMVVALKIETDDIIRYDQKAKDNLITGVCTLARASKDDMWAP